MSHNSKYTEKEFESILETYGDMVVRVANSRLNNIDDAQDVAQTVFIKLLSQPKLFNTEDHLKAWILRTTINCCIDYFRNPWNKPENRTVYNPELTYGLTENTEAFDEPDNTKLKKALLSLNATRRTILHLYYYEELSTNEIADICNMKPSTVRSHLKRARKQLEKELGGAQ